MQNENDLLNAVISRDEIKMKSLLDNGADVNVKIWDSNLLIRAIMRGYKDIVDLLIYYGADVNDKNQLGETPLMISVLLYQKEIVSLLLDSGANIHETNKKGETAFDIAIRNNYLDIVHMIEDTQGKEGFITSALCGDLYTMKKMYNEKININIKDKHGFTALMKASASGFEQIVDFLLEKGADVNILSKDRSTALRFAAGYGHKK